VISGASAAGRLNSAQGRDDDWLANGLARFFGSMFRLLFSLLGLNLSIDRLGNYQTGNKHHGEPSDERLETLWRDLRLWQLQQLP
jgi:hypothetical protein